jgi:Flp pilus assembly protein TadD
MSDLLDAGIARYRDGAFADAAAIFASLRDGHPDDATILRLNGLSLVRAGDPLAALPLLARAQALAPGDPLAHLHLGIGLHAAGDLAQAARLFRHCVTLMPGQAAPLINLAVVLLDQNEGAAARDAAAAAVTADPASAEGHLALARACAACHDPTSAIPAFETALRLRPKDADAWVSFGAALYRFGESERAFQALHQALAIAPRHPLAHANLAALEGLRGEQAAGIARLRAVLVEQPDCGLARLNLANLLLQDRDAEQALAVLSVAAPAGGQDLPWRSQRAAALLMLGRRAEARSEIASAVGPAGDASITLGWLRIALDDGLSEPEIDRRIAELDALAERDGGLPEHRIIARFDLGNLQTRRGRRAAGFAHWAKAHRLLARTQPFSRSRYAAFFAALRRHFDASPLNAGPRAQNADPAPVFIIGLPRSGTTLTEQILAAHPMVHAAGERLSVHELVLRLAGSTLTAASVTRLASLDGAALDDAAGPFLAALHHLAPGASIVTDKMPGNGLHLGFLARLLPGARVIRCMRDPRDIGLSIFQRRFFGYHPYAHDLADLGWYIGQHEAAMRYWESALPVPMITIALTDWIEDFDATIARLLAFLCLPADAACQRFYELDRRVQTASRDQVRRPINDRGIGRWRSYEAELQPMIMEMTKAGLLPPAGSAICPTSP